MRIIMALCGLLICVAAASGVSRAEDSMAEFTQQTLDGRTVRSEALKGRPVVVTIGSHW